MVRTVYVPVLPTTRAARRAYEHMDASVRCRIEPLWTVVPRVGPERLRDAPPVSDPETDETLLSDWLAPRVNDLIETMGDNPGWVDAAHVERLIHGSADSLWHLAVKSRLRLVTGPERAPRHQRYAADLTFLSGRSLGIRLALHEPLDPHGSLRPQLLDLIDRLCLPPSRLDLILDLGPVTDAGEAVKTALIAIDLLGALVPWRTLVLTAGAFPRGMDDIDIQPTRTAVRHDWRLHHLVRTARPGTRSQFAGVTCGPGACDVRAKSVTRSQGGSGKSRAVPRGGAARLGGGGGEPKELPPIMSGGGRMGIWRRFDPGEAKKPKSKDKRQVPVELVVRQALRRLKLPKPVIRTSPGEDFVQVVHVPTWMWVDRSTWGPVSTSAEVEGAKVTATARPRRAVWSMGEGGQVVCLGPGTPYSDAYSPNATSPDCGYTYRRASLSAPGRAYTVSVQVTWDVEWHEGGQAGVVPGLVMTAERRLVVDEVQTVVTR